MPERFDPIPDEERFDAAPAGVAVPSSGIFDPPAHIAIINREWIHILLGLIDRGGYSNVWKDSDDELFAYRQINELQAQIMTSPYSNILGGERVDNFVYVNNALTTDQTVDLLTTDAVSTYMLTSVTLRLNSGIIDRILLSVENAAGTENSHILDLSSAATFTLYTRDAMIFMKPSAFLRARLIGVAPTSGLYVSAHYVVLAE